MTRVVLSLGSNIEAERHIKGGLLALDDTFGPVNLSPVYESKAVGFDGDDFLNLVASFETDLGLEEVAALLAAMEAEVGRRPEQRGFSPRALDIDLLTYGSFVGQQNGISIPRPHMLDYAFVLKPLADLLPDDKHPGLERNYAELWREFPQKEEQPLWVSTVDWDADWWGLGTAKRAL